jgi:predicted RNA-binding protein with TRAM domain
VLCSRDRRWDFFLYIHSFILGIAFIGYELILMSYRTQRGGSYGDNRNFGAKPVEVGKEYEVQVTETSYKGDGVARVQGFVIFVKNGKTGEKVKVKVNSVGSRFAIAEIV